MGQCTRLQQFPLWVVSPQNGGEKSMLPFRAVLDQTPWQPSHQALDDGPSVQVWLQMRATDSPGQSLTPVPLQESMFCAGCGKQVCDHFFLLAAGSVWHNVCLRCSQCHCELQTHPSLYFRDGAIYCHQDYYRMFGGGQCAHCPQTIPASSLAVTSSDPNIHPYCFSCQECDVKLQSQDQCRLQSQNICCQSPHNPNFTPCPKEDY
ncbi:LIM domain only protein 3-like [Thalassophryne amazonica]|uniref:LIM domain only protein 3-like n=1 Tax=Thalassophryne amazonica TaxID=390379 RepID=UPI0014709A9A|nr:LIM domain only protein 3-like [Thalassophryne amazonica]